jgi:hypothetical protein
MSEKGEGREQIAATSTRDLIQQLVSRATQAEAERDRMTTAYQATNDAYGKESRRADNEKLRADAAERERDELREAVEGKRKWLSAAIALDREAATKPDHCLIRDHLTARADAMAEVESHLFAALHPQDSTERTEHG